MGVITQRATDILRKHGVTVIHEDASLDKDYFVDLAVFCHFDGSTNPDAKKASVGYDDPTDKPASDDWKAAYSTIWNYGWHADNFTSNLSGYYGYKYTYTQDSEFVIEFGTISNDEVAFWIKERLLYLGEFLAWWISKRIAKGNVPKPQAFDSGHALGDVHKALDELDARIRSFQAQYASHLHKVNVPMVNMTRSTGTVTSAKPA
jgi:hypothetical protein